MYIPQTPKSKHLSAIIQLDGGSSVNLIREDLARKLGVKRIPTRTIRCRGIGGLVTISHECILNLKFHGHRVECKYLKSSSTIGTRFLIMHALCPSLLVSILLVISISSLILYTDTLLLATLHALSVPKSAISTT